MEKKKAPGMQPEQPNVFTLKPGATNYLESKPTKEMVFLLILPSLQD